MGKRCQGESTRREPKKRRIDGETKSSEDAKVPVFASDSHAETSDQKSILSCDTFASLDICEPLKRALEAMGLTRMTQIQCYAIPKLLEGRDLLGSAKTGSGKTLAFVIPALDLLYRAKVEPKLGTVALVLTPTRELAIQIGEVIREAGQFVSHTFGTVIGGSKKKTEAEKLAKGVNLLVATPGRLLDHIQTTKEFVYKNLQMLIIDEADRMLEQGFERELTAIVKVLPKKRQTALFSATQSPKVGDLIRLSMKEPVLVEIKDQQATVSGLQQGYIICSSEQRLALLFKLLQKKQQKNEKVMVFFSSCAAVQFYDDLFNYLDLKCTSLHGKKKQAARTTIYNNFLTAKSGILLCTGVAARGLDFPCVDWIVQFDPPGEVTDYIHRVGRTARGDGGIGSALLFLLPEEIGLIAKLAQRGVKAKEFKSSAKDLGKIYESISRVVSKNFHLAQGAREAYKGFMLAYNSHSQKDIFNVKQLDIVQVAKSFGMDVPPRVDLGQSIGAL